MKRLTRRRAAVYAAGMLAAARWWWRSGQPPFPMRVGVLVWGVRGHGRGEPEPTGSGPPEEALP